jgi:hypothetical protein
MSKPVIHPEYLVRYRPLKKLIARLRRTGAKPALHEFISIG